MGLIICFLLYIMKKKLEIHFNNEIFELSKIM